ncbi:MAG: sigma-54 dependent transcriptional regulator [Acidobacteriota bacterium]
MTLARPLLLLVDDDPHVREVVGRLAVESGFDVLSCADGRAALQQLHRQPVFALVDLCMPDVDGIEVLRSVRARVPSCEMVLMSGDGTIDAAVEAIKLGARDYLAKPLDFDRLRALLASVLEEAARRRSVLEAEGELARRLEFCGMVGRSPAMQQTFALIRRLAPHVRQVLICGETGTGKELAARALHALGPRRDRRFITVNCSAVVDTLFESELFGHVRGAFTGAVESKAGLFERADGATLFLDEIGELPLTAQAKLLRVLESGEIQRVGSAETRQVDVHVLAATNRNLRSEVGAGRFRMDLLYRLNAIQLDLPPLREHREDVPYLMAAFIRECNARFGKTLAGVTAGAERLLVNAHWEGNVRELKNVIERACILAEGDLITEGDLACLGSSGWVAAATVASQTRPEHAVPCRPPTPGRESHLSSIEREHIVRMLDRTGGNKKAAARLLGIDRRKLYRYLERHQLHVPARKTAPPQDDQPTFTVAACG